VRVDSVPCDFIFVERATSDLPHIMSPLRSRINVEVRGAVETVMPDNEQTGSGLPSSSPRRSHGREDTHATRAAIQDIIEEAKKPLRSSQQ